MYFVPDKVKGESQDAKLKEKKAFELTEFTLKAENATNIGSMTQGGGGAGKVKFDRLSFKKRSDSATTDIFRELAKGTHFDEVNVVMRRNQLPYLEFKFVMCVLAEMETTQSGDDEAEDSVVLDYGAVKISYTAQTDKGEAGTHATAMWSRVKNEFSDKVT
ncbi:type VI secretion system tube protein Hcp [Paralimibaculum aggregatum]|uniref:Type VI secretion system tube protein Hcp n=1 Tax=Paralimibaculum aggregatum TaxID=3036245 RepID=A0ABQ6LF50_9RHOB|nr:type VI secretion system tube protein Hcp [Limibaculum sp. NKW23]GMG81612.1 type VI secretion system tube protein Hcp [Limibaculum sp. NKW23]